MSGLVWAVATGAFALFNRFVCYRSQIQFVMAGIAELSYIGNRIEFVQVLIALFMAECTILGGYRAVDKFILTHIRVAIRSDAALALFQRKS